MKKYFLILLSSLILKTEAQNLNAVGASNIIPLAANCAEKKGVFTVTDNTPVFDGAADPTVIWNDKTKEWLNFYTAEGSHLN